MAVAMHAGVASAPPGDWSDTAAAHAGSRTAFRHERIHEGCRTTVAPEPGPSAYAGRHA